MTVQDRYPVFRPDCVLGNLQGPDGNYFMLVIHVRRCLREWAPQRLEEWDRRSSLTSGITYRGLLTLIPEFVEPITEGTTLAAWVTDERSK